MEGFFARVANRVTNLLLLVGLTLLAVWTFFNVHRVVGEMSARDYVATAQAASSPAEPDFTLWSDKRIKAYKAALLSQFSQPVGLIRIPRFQTEAAILKDTSEWSLNRGAGHIEGSAPLDGQGNAGIASHRDGFFRVLKDIAVNDEIVVETKSGTRKYLVDQIQIVDPEKVDVLQQRAAPSLTLVTCYPFYFIGDAPLRFIVQASLEEENGATQTGQPSGAQN